MVAAFWRHGSLAALAATLLMAQHAAADPARRTTAKGSKPVHPAVTAQPSPAGIAPLSLRMTAPLGPLTHPRVTLQQTGSVLERVPTASWAMGCAAGIALAMHAVYQSNSDRHRMRMKSCADECPNYRIDHYQETRERADVALRLSVFAAASALWLVYNDPQEALERMGQRKLPPQQPGFRVKVKPERRGVWASVVAYF